MSEFNLFVTESKTEHTITIVPSTQFTASVVFNAAPSFSLAVGNVVTIANKADSASYASHANTAVSALTASYALASSGKIENAVSASYAESASYAPASFPYTGDAEITGSLKTTDAVQANQLSIQSNGGLFVISGSVTTGILGVTENIYPTIPKEQFTGAVIEYVAQRPNGVRIGMVLGVWSGSAHSFTDVSATDIGDTSDIVTGFLMLDDRIQFQVHSAGSGSGTWTVQTLFKLFPKLT
jgi:hypothetical protein